MTAELQHCPASEVPPPRAKQRSTVFATDRHGREHILLVTRNNHADRDLAVVGTIGGIKSAAAGVEANFSAQMAAERIRECGGVELPGLGRRWRYVLRHRVLNIFEDAGAWRKG